MPERASTAVVFGFGGDFHWTCPRCGWACWITEGAGSPANMAATLRYEAAEHRSRWCTGVKPL